MTDTKKQEIAAKAEKPAAQTGSELSEQDLSQASGGALNAYKPVSITDGTHSGGGGGGAGLVGHIWVDKSAAGDGSV
ncbi:hypothetical protein [Dongia sp.]|uniref:hypothetical protein n=1 Tax=Dongia sp. TaxID=1977262 RepID=UPI0037507EC9